MTEQQKIEKRLASLATAATLSTAARNDLEKQIRAARSAGLSLRAIADAAGVSHEWIRQLTRSSSSAKSKTKAAA